MFDIKKYSEIEINSYFCGFGFSFSLFLRLFGGPGCCVDVVNVSTAGKVQRECIMTKITHYLHFSGRAASLYLAVSECIPPSGLDGGP